MLWIFLTIASYLLFTLSSLVDRYLLAGPLKKPLVYTFYINITAIFALALIPFGFFVPKLYFIGMSFAAGAASVFALYFLFRAIRAGSVARVVPMVGAIIPIVTLVLSLLFLDARSPGFQGSIAFGLLVAATFLLSLNVVRGRFVPSFSDLIHVVITAIFFAISFILLKVVYDNITFINGIIWTRIFAFLIALSFLSIPYVRHSVFKENPVRQRRVYVPGLLGKIFGTAGSLMQQYAIALAAVGQLAFINAMQGIQYIALLALVALIAKYRPRILREQLSKTGFLVKSLGILALSAGLYMLFQSI